MDAACSNLDKDSILGMHAIKSRNRQAHLRLVGMGRVHWNAREPVTPASQVYTTVLSLFLTTQRRRSSISTIFADCSRQEEARSAEAELLNGGEQAGDAMPRSARSSRFFI